MMRLLSPLLVAWLVFLTTPLQAADSAELTSLRQQQVAVFAIVREFHMQTMLSGDPGRTAQLKSAVDALGKAVQANPANSGNGELDQAFTAARTSAQKFTRLALANNILRDGYTDDNLVGDLYTEADVLANALAKAAAALPAQGKQRAQADKAHATNLLLQRAVASYLKRSAQMSPDVGAEDPFDVGEATTRLDRQIQELARELPRSEAMQTVKSKWNFIRGSMANYNEKAVPFIIDRSARQIGDALLQVVAELDGK